jgi:hypothetical protein
MPNQPIEEKWKETFRRDFRCPVCIGVTMDSECQPIDCGECGGSTFNPDWDYKSAESFIENLLEQEKRRMSEEIGSKRIVSKEMLRHPETTAFNQALDLAKAIINK